MIPEVEGGMMAILHIDLLWTDLEDFVEHFTQALNDPGTRSQLLGDDVVWIAWNSREDRLTDDYYLTEEEREDLIGNNNYVQIYQFIAGKTTRRYQLFRVSEETITASGMVAVTHYRRDRLNLAIADEPDWGFADRLLQWLRPRWRTAIEILEAIDAPELSKLPEMPKLTPKLYLTAQYLAQGMSDEEISKERVVAVSTVETQRKDIAKKLGIKSNKNTITKALKELGY